MASADLSAFWCWRWCCSSPFFPKELAAREAERRIEEATGRDLVLGNNIEISFWPALGFSVDNASLSNPDRFQNPARRGGVDAAGDAVHLS